MLDAKQISNLKSQYPEPDKLVHAVNIGSHNEAIKQAQATVAEHADTGKIDANLAAAELLQLLLPQVSEEIVLEDTQYEWMTVSDWVRLHGKQNPADLGWLLEEDRLYRPRAVRPRLAAA